jgi:hypothetical protein
MLFDAPETILRSALNSTRSRDVSFTAAFGMVNAIRKMRDADAGY